MNSEGESRRGESEDGSSRKVGDVEANKKITQKRSRPVIAVVAMYVVTSRRYNDLISRESPYHCRSISCSISLSPVRFSSFSLSSLPSLLFHIMSYLSCWRPLRRCCRGHKIVGCAGCRRSGQRFTKRFADLKSIYFCDFLQLGQVPVPLFYMMWLVSA